MKKILYVLIVSLLLCSMLSACGNSNNDPIYIAEMLDEEEYWVEIVIDDDDIDDISDELELNAKKIRYVIYAEPEDWDDEKAGFFILCESEESAKDTEEDLTTYLNSEDCDLTFVRTLITRSGNVIFFGCEDVWECIQ